MVTPARFERTTYRLGGGCSIQLSYGASFYYPINQKMQHQQTHSKSLLQVRQGLSKLEDFAKLQLSNTKRGSAFQKR